MGDPLLDDEPQGTWYGEFFRTWVPAIVLVLGIRTFVFEPFQIPSGSMVPTLLIGDHVVINKSSYGLWVPTSLLDVPFIEDVCAGMGFNCVTNRYELVDFGDPERGDVIVFRYPVDPKTHYIKRVVGIAGDRIKVRNNQITLNGEVQKREYIERYDFLNGGCNKTLTKKYVETFGDRTHNVLTNAGTFGGPLANAPKGGGEFVVPEGHVFVMGDNRDNSEDSRKWKFVPENYIKGKAHFVLFSLQHCGEGIMRSDRYFKGLYTPPEGPKPTP